MPSPSPDYGVSSPVPPSQVIKPVLTERLAPALEFLSQLLRDGQGALALAPDRPHTTRCMRKVPELPLPADTMRAS
jgi:hypothetical protein